MGNEEEEFEALCKKICPVLVELETTLTTFINKNEQDPTQGHMGVCYIRNQYSEYAENLIEYLPKLLKLCQHVVKHGTCKGVKDG